MKSKIILWDLETSHNLAAVFQLKQDYISPDNIVKERYIISAAWKILGEKKIHSISVLDNPKLFEEDNCNDYHVVKELHKILSDADILIAHNGDKFDLKMAEARMLIHGLPPLPPIRTIDTLKIAKKRFLFNANRLDYLGKILNVGRKIHTDNTLWLKVLKGDKTAISKMVEYNKGDVALLERIFLKLRPYITNYLPSEFFDTDNCGCSRCGSKKLQKRGVARNATRVYQRFQCVSCGGWSRALRADPSTAQTRNL